MSDGLTAGIIQDDHTGQVLMLGYLSPEALRLTRETGLVHFHSRSRNQLWKKGETSGNTLSVVSISDDCDGDAILIRAIPAGPTCHTGAVSCFGDEEPVGTLSRLEATILSRRDRRPQGSYTVSLLNEGVEAIARKVVEEAVEVLLAATNQTDTASTDRVAEEAADLVYHLMVLLAGHGIELRAVLDVLEQRAKLPTKDD
jgi:phosphoribosyl-ATP pyrophosphohydrolase/phosphoribosyl-AMP cyclohydrolase